MDCQETLNRKAMKNYLLLIVTILQITICSAQQFSFQMNFVDAVGNKDSVILGYDIAGTDTIDPAFGEINIVNTPYSSGLDVRLGNGYFFPAGVVQTPFETKKQIIYHDCNISSNIEFHIVASNYPVKIYWNRNLFNDTCRKGSLYTEVDPSGRWDVGGYFIKGLYYNDSITIPNIYYNSYLNSSDTVNVYWVQFGNSTLLSGALAIEEHYIAEGLITINPNPASDFISINIDKMFGEVKMFELYNSFGQIILLPKQLNDIDISELPSGLYFIKIINSRGLVVSKKLLKAEN